MVYTYPSTDLERPATLAALFGSFWSEYYDGADQIEKFAEARAQLEMQTEQNLDEAIAATSRLKIPVFHTDLWYQLVLRESEMNTRDFSIPKYGEGYVYGEQPADGTTLLYGDVVNKNVYAFAAPDGLAKAPLIVNRSDLPTVSWVDGLDFVLDDGYLQLLYNPFDNEFLPVRDVYSESEIVDREVSLWLFRSQWDQEFIWTHYGHVLGINLPSSQRYLDLINALWDAMVEGGNLDAICSALAAITDTPVATVDDEVVERIVQDSTRLLVITDQNCYRCAREATAAVAVGDVLAKGQFITEAVQVFAPAHQDRPDWFRAFGIDETLTGREYRGGLLFIGQDLPVTVDISGAFTELRFSLYGQDATVESFWDDIHARGIEAGETLAHLLDNRPEENQASEPLVDALPATINPLDFLVDNLLHNNALFVTLHPADFGSDSLPMWTLGLLRRLIAPTMSLFILVSMTAEEDETLTAEEDMVPFMQLPDALEDGLLLANYCGEILIPAGYVDQICG